MTFIFAIATGLGETAQVVRIAKGGGAGTSAAGPVLTAQEVGVGVVTDALVAVSHHGRLSKTGALIASNR